MLVPSIFGENLFDDWFDVDFPQWPEFRDLDRRSLIFMEVSNHLARRLFF